MKYRVNLQFEKKTYLAREAPGHSAAPRSFELTRHDDNNIYQKVDIPWIHRTHYLLQLLQRSRIFPREFAMAPDGKDLVDEVYSALGGSIRIGCRVV